MAKRHKKLAVVDLVQTELELCGPLEGSNVFVLGNTGTGKSTLLQWINGADFKLAEPEDPFSPESLTL